jgi:DMSO reductase anchor subunit
MHPAFSVIFFTVISGAGYGLMMLVGGALMLRPDALTRTEAIVALLLGGAFTVAGLFSSLLHLGQPTRAWRAFSQWRTSWLSREGVAAVITFVPLLAVTMLSWRGVQTDALRLCGLLLVLFAVATLYCTSGIYTSLKTIAAWHNRYVWPGYLLLGGASGAVWLLAIDAFGGGAVLRVWLVAATVLLAVAAAALKFAYWRFIDAPYAGPTIESATGLGGFGSVRSVEAPHTEENYLTNEMGFRLARKHARRLRAIAVFLIVAAPVLFAVIAMVELSSALVAIAALTSALCVLLGTFVERWLFFAEARHVVMLYYSSDRV